MKALRDRPVPSAVVYRLCMFGRLLWFWDRAIRRGAMAEAAWARWMVESHQAREHVGVPDWMVCLVEFSHEEARACGQRVGLKVRRRFRGDEWRFLSIPLVPLPPEDEAEFSRVARQFSRPERGGGLN